MVCYGIFWSGQFELRLNLEKTFHTGLWRFAVKNEMQTDRKRIGFVVWMLFVFVFASFRGRGLGKM